jgi:hypothetical protein
MFSNDRVTAVVGQPEQCVSLNSAWPFSEPAICEAWQLTLICQQHWHCTHFMTVGKYLLPITSLPRKFNNAPPFYESPTHAPELFHIAPIASKAFKINIKKMQTLCVDSDFSTERVAKLSGQTLYVFLQIRCLLFLSSFHHTWIP